ncbi:hypothetical protein [Saccharospirillum impatiens]|uniref:hypothetical protein n=1 Tax=Saccharospirillum impatiens TaxID=169438 RepID=UPI00041284D8|nr:hypothetical protein [Saccharospirillum impatiens]
MSTASIDKALDQALGATEGEQSLQRFIAVFHRKHPHLLIVEHGSLERRLTAMLIQYCRLLPILLDEAKSVTGRHSSASDFDALHGIVEAFFSSLEPKRLTFGVLGILDKVYFGHRLLEEWHDRHRLDTHRTALSWDTSLSNILVHTLIGDGYANELDAAVRDVIDTQPRKEGDTIDAKKIRHPAPPFPCLASRHGVSLAWSR